MRYPGERVQVDVKYVPKACMTKELIERNERYYQYTAIDEYTRFPMRPLKWLSPNNKYKEYIRNESSIIV